MIIDMQLQQSCIDDFSNSQKIIDKNEHHDVNQVKKDKQNKLSVNIDVQLVITTHHYDELLKQRQLIELQDKIESLKKNNTSINNHDLSLIFFMHNSNSLQKNAIELTSTK